MNELPGWLYRPMWLVQILGVLGTPVVLAVVALLWRKWRLAPALLLLVPLKLFVELRVIKALVERGRPGEKEPGAVLRHVPPAGLSFPPVTRSWSSRSPSCSCRTCAAGGVRCRSGLRYWPAWPGCTWVRKAGAGAGDHVERVVLLGGLLTLLVGVPAAGPPGRDRGSAARATDAGAAEG